MAHFSTCTTIWEASTSFGVSETKEEEIIGALQGQVQSPDRPVRKVIQETWWPGITAHKQKKVNWILLPVGRSPAPHSAEREKRQTGVISMPMFLVLETANCQLSLGKRKSSCRTAVLYKPVSLLLRPLAYQDIQMATSSFANLTPLFRPLKSYAWLWCMLQHQLFFLSFPKRVLSQTCKTPVQNPGTKA